MEDVQGQYVPQFVDDEGQPMFNRDGNRVAEPVEFVRLFLARPENANLVKTQMAPGSGAKPPGGPAQPPPDGLPMTLDQFKALSPEDRQAVAHKLTPEQMAKLVGAEKPQADEGYIQ